MPAAKFPVCLDIEKNSIKSPDSFILASYFVADISASHPAKGKCIEKRANKTIPEMIFAGSSIAGIMRNGKLLDCTVL